MNKLVAEWKNEPDCEEFEYKGYKCFLTRNVARVWCGYVALPKGHMFYGKSYNEIPIEVHGGLTYAEKGVLSSDKKNYYFIGFDCGHLGDLLPSLEDAKNTDPKDKKIAEMIAMLSELESHVKDLMQNKKYRNIEYARNECRSMVDQIEELIAQQKEFQCTYN